MSAMKDFAIFEMSLDFVAIDAIGFICSQCFELTSTTDLHQHHHAPGAMYCADCFDQYYSTCVHCNEPCRNDESTSYGDDRLCGDCYNRCYFTCERCDEIAPNDDRTDIDDESWCADCRTRHATRCSDCNNWTQDENAISCGCGSVCQSCYENDYFTCERCDEVCRNDNAARNGYCEDCEPERDPDSIMDYSTNILDVIHVHIDRTKILYGIELEVTSTTSDPDSDASECRDALGSNFAITKYDGSLGSSGFEIVTIPATLKQHTKRWNDLLDSPPRGLRSWKNPKCGMHVHVSRDPLSLLTIGKILVFVNAPENKGFIVAIAGRESAGYAEIKAKKIVDVKRGYNRFEAINLTHPGTIEFRIFKGTLKKTSFLKNLEFVASSVAFCRQTGIHQLDIPSFLAWFKPVRKDYPNLDQWLIKHNHIPSRSKANKKAGA
jgi:hypothetical protein